MKISVHSNLLLIMASLLLQSCAGESSSAIQTAAVQTQEFSQLETSIANFAENQAQENTPVPEQESPPTLTPTEESPEQKQARVHQQQGENLYYEGSYEGAAARFTLAIELSPQFADAFYFRSQAKRMLSIEITSAFFNDQQDINDLQISLVLMQEALADYTMAIELDPQFADDYFDEGSVYYEMGILNEDLGNKQAAIDNYSLFLNLYPYEDSLTDYASDTIESLSP